VGWFMHPPAFGFTHSPFVSVIRYSEVGCKLCTHDPETVSVKSPVSGWKVAHMMEKMPSGNLQVVSMLSLLMKWSGA